MQTDYEIGIIGAGFGGLIAALELKKAGKNSFVIFERASEVGGTWRDNHYPGCGCDVRSHLYSMAAAKNPYWSQSFSSSREILHYLKDVANENKLTEHIRFNSKIVSLQFKEAHGCWEVTDEAGGRCIVKMMILATGPYNNPVIPAIDGADTFEGKAFHTYHWDHTVDFTNKKVAVIGTGASAIQIVPELAPIVANLSVYQRTPAWIIARNNRRTTGFEKWLFRKMSFTQLFVREAIYWLTEIVGISFVGNKPMNNLLTYLARKKIKREVKDPAVRRKLEPNYTIGCKRILLSDDFYPSFNRPNVQLVTDTISKITSSAIITADGAKHDTDIIVYATGFVVADINRYIRITGLQNQVLTNKWDVSGAEAFRGITVAGFPNLAFILGPNSGIGHSSVIHIMESQMKYILHYIKRLSKCNENGYLDVKQEAQQQYNDTLQQKLAGTVWASGCNSFYLNTKGKNTTIYPHLTRRYRKETAQLDIDNYRVC